jgi:hypothetical protein
VEYSPFDAQSQNVFLKNKTKTNKQTNNNFQILWKPEMMGTLLI